MEMTKSEKMIERKTVILCVLAFLLGIFLGKTLFSQTSYLITTPGNAKQTILSAIKNANKEILISVYVLTSHDVIDALKKAKERGVKVIVLVDGNVGANAEAVEALRNEGIVVKCVSKPYKHLHAKFIIVDNKLIIVGSHNLTNSALLFNREVSVVIENIILSSQLRSIFFEDFDKGYVCFAK